MQFFKKRKDKPLENLSTEKTPPWTGQIITRWSDEKAEYIYVLQQYQLDCYIGGNTPHYSWVDVAWGDEDWAKRISHHYGIQFNSSSKIRHDYETYSAREEKKCN